MKTCPVDLARESQFIRNHWLGSTLCHPQLSDHKYLPSARVQCRPVERVCVNQAALTL